MDLLLWRHADAFDARPGEDDAQRALTPQGEQQAQRIGRWLASVLPGDARILVSPAKRTQQTAGALGRPFETVQALASGASVAAVLQAAGWPRSRQPVLVVGHQPTLGLAASMLMCGTPQHWSVARASVWWLRAEHHGRARLVAVRSPEHEA
jgi:phosphohistidine phosphatase